MYVCILFDFDDFQYERENIQHLAPQQTFRGSQKICPEKQTKTEKRTIIGLEKSNN